MALQASFDKNIAVIYFLANTPMSLYKTLRNNFFICDVLSQIKSEELINEFKKRASQQINNGDAMAELYALLIALTFKNKDEVRDFFENYVMSINYEWFSEIAKIYLSDPNENPNFNTVIIDPVMIGKSFDNQIEVLSPEINYID